jgi:hypothetical protein
MSGAAEQAEAMSGPPLTAWFLDVDGPVSDPERKRVTRPRVLDELVLRLEHGEPVILNTGRSLAWVLDHVVAPLRQRCLVAGLDPDALMRDRFAVVGEKGGALATYRADGALVLEHDRRLAVPLEVRAAVARLVESGHGAAMFVDAGKETMVSVEMADGLDVATYRPAQAAFTAELTALLDDLGMGGGQVRVDATRIAVDVQHPRAGKALGAERGLAWLRSRGVRATRAVCVGDSASDIEMADATHAAGLATEFVFVGADLDAAFRHRPYRVTVTRGHMERGTEEILVRDRLTRGLRRATPGDTALAI